MQERDWASWIGRIEEMKQKLSAENRLRAAETSDPGVWGKPHAAQR